MPLCDFAFVAECRHGRIPCWRAAKRVFWITNKSTVRLCVIMTPRQDRIRYFSFIVASAIKKTRSTMATQAVMWLFLYDGNFACRIILFHNYFSSSGKQPEQRILAGNPEQVTVCCMTIFHKYWFLYKTWGYYNKINFMESLGVCYW